LGLFFANGAQAGPKASGASRRVRVTRGKPCKYKGFQGVKPCNYR